MKAASYQEVGVGRKETQKWVAVAAAVLKWVGHNRILDECVRGVLKWLQDAASCSRPMSRPTLEMQVLGPS